MQRYCKIESAVRESIPVPVKLYADSKKINDIQQLEQFFPQLIAITDGTEQQDPKTIPRERLTIQAKRKISSKESNHNQSKQ